MFLYSNKPAKVKSGLKLLVSAASNTTLRLQAAKREIIAGEKASFKVWRYQEWGITSCESFQST